MTRASAPLTLAQEVGRESVLLIGGRRALLLQIAHPLVARGVADHSNFERDRFGRLLRTLELSYTVIFGSPEEAASAITRVRQVHSFVTGRLPEDAGIYREGTQYRADDPELLLWVHATLVDTALTVFEMFVRGLDDQERDRYWDEASWATEDLGIPPEVLPQSYGEFRTYWEGMLIGDRLAVTPTTNRIASSLLYPRSPLIPKRLVDPLNTITIGLLPPRVRELYRLRWGPARIAAFKMAKVAISSAMPMVPRRLRYIPSSFPSRLGGRGDRTPSNEPRD